MVLISQTSVAIYIIMIIIKILLTEKCTNIP